MSKTKAAVRRMMVEDRGLGGSNLSVLEDGEESSSDARIAAAAAQAIEEAIQRRICKPQSVTEEVVIPGRNNSQSVPELIVNLEAAAAQAVEEAIQMRSSTPQLAEDDWYQEEQDAIEEQRAADAAEEHHRPPDPEEVAAVAEEALEQAIQRRADVLIGPLAPQFMPEKSYQGHREGRVFKKGAEGMGYYVDLGPIEQRSLSDILCPLLASPPATVK